MLRQQHRPTNVQINFEAQLHTLLPCRLHLEIAITDHNPRLAIDWLSLVMQDSYPLDETHIPRRTDTYVNNTYLSLIIVHQTLFDSTNIRILSYPVTLQV